MTQREDFPLEPETHRALLDLLNGALTPEELREHPVGEHLPEDAGEVIKFRDLHHPYGFRHVGELIEEGLLERNLLPDLGTAITQSNGTWRGPLKPGLPQTITKKCGNFVPGHAALLKTEEVLILPAESCEQTVIYDPAQDAYRLPGNQPTDVLYCSGHAFLADGKLLVVGGGGGGPSDAIKSAWIFDPDDQANGRQGVWKQTRRSKNGPAAKMNQARWYPHCVTIGGGRVLIAGGDHTKGQQKDLEIYDYDFTQPEFGQFKPVSIDAPVSQNDRFLNEYPGLHLLPNQGEVFHSRADWRDPVPGGDNATFRFTNSYTAGKWDSLQNTMAHPDRSNGMSVQILERTGSGSWVSKVLVVGGGAPGTQDTAEMIDLSKQTPNWKDVSWKKAERRKNLNVVLLPTGSAFVCGGVHHTKTPCAVFDPDTGSWSKMARLQMERTHHSVAVLLLSGEVMVTGGDDAQDPNSVEVFQPPYMQGTSRPKIDGSSVPARIHHGGQFSLTSPDAGSIQEVVLVRPMAVTHSKCSEQRVIPMDFTQSGNTLSVTAPNGNHPHPVAPRGYYTLWIIDSNGTPSEAEFIHLH